MGTKAKFYVATSSGWVEANFGSTGSGSFYGVSSESSTTRTATLTNDDGNFELVVGATVNIKFTHASSSGSMTLNVNNTGEKPIKQNSSNTTEWKAGAIINLVYDGSNWIVSGVGSTVDTDKKTASTPSNEKLYLIGSTAQGTDGQATYSNSNVYTKNGVIYANGVNTSSISSNSSIAFYAGGGGESSIEYSNISGTGVISNGHFISYGDDDNSNENKPANKTDFTDLDSYYFNTGITLYDSDSSRKYKLSFPAKSGTFATLDDTKIEAGTGLQLSGTTFSANLNSTTSLGTIGSTSKLYPVGVDVSGKLAVYVPWVDTNTDTHYTNYFQIKGNGTEAIKFTQNADKSLNFKSGNNVSISAATNEITISATVPTKVSDLTDSNDYALKSDITSLFKFQGSKTSIDNLPTSPEPGDVYNISNAFTANSKFPNDNGKSFPAGTNVVYVSGESNNYWEVLGGTYSNATTTTSGLMSSGDKSKLNGIADNANNYSHPATHPASMITGLAKVATSGQYSDLSGALTLSGNGSATTAARSDHNHSGVYSPVGHTHSDYVTSAFLGQNYYTKSEVDDDFATASHNHDSKYAPISHNHDDRYYTETEIDTKIKGTSNAIPKFTSANSIGDSVITQDNHNNITVAGKMIVKSSGSTSGNFYNEGIRILPASNGWSELFFSNDQSTDGTHANGWILGKRGASGSTSGAAGDFTIESNGSTGTGLTLYANGNKPRWNNNELAYKSEIPTSLPASDVYAWAKASSKPTYNFSEINSRGEAYLEWGGQNINNSWSPIDAAMVPSLGANRMAFALARGITVEYSRDGGATWTDYGLSDSQKTALFSGPMARANIRIGKPTYNSSTKKYENVGINNRARITIDTNSSTGSYIYTILNKFVVDITSSGSGGCKVIIEGQTKANSDAGNNTWENFANTDISGWSGYNIINTSGITTYGNSSWQYTKLRFTFYCTTNSRMEQYGGLTIMNIYGFGGYGWNTPSYMAKWGSIYHYDAAQNASFPAGVSATSFTENGTSLANKYAPKSHTHKAAASGSTATTINTYSMNYSNGVLTITSGTTNVASTSHTHDVS